MLGWASACFYRSPGLEPDALSLSHLTYVDATLTIRFHRLDHPPFPCTASLRPAKHRRKLLLGHQRPLTKPLILCIPALSTVNIGRLT